MASRTASEIWSAILSGCPSVTDSDVNRWREAMASPGMMAPEQLHPVRLGGRTSLRLRARALGQTSFEFVDARDVGGVHPAEQREVEAQEVPELNQGSEPRQPAATPGADLVHGRTLASRVLRCE